VDGQLNIFEPLRYYLAVSQRKYITATRTNPQRLEGITFNLKTNLLRLKKIAASIGSEQPHALPKTNGLYALPIIAESNSPLWTNDSDDKGLVAGKIQNLRVAVRSLNGIEVGPNQVFSFWKQVGRATRRKGYVEGRELREGCLIPSVGGGLCQLSNALYDAALQAGFEIVERHRHTRIIPGSLAESDRDATVFWNYVDLCFRSTYWFRVEAELTSDMLVVRFRGNKQPKLRLVDTDKTRVTQKTECASCDKDSCFRKTNREVAKQFGQTAFLVDECWPEFDSYIQSTRTNTDSLFLPIDGPSFLRQNYDWESNGFRDLRTARWRVLLRSFQSRWVHSKPAVHRRLLLDQSDRLAQSFARRLKPTHTHLVITQTLLPFLWRDGHLGGRTFDVLMTQLPLRQLQQRLDDAFSIHPNSPTLADFRVDDSLLQLEDEALQNAQQLIATHSEIASLFADRVKRLNWSLHGDCPNVRSSTGERRILFPASTLGRKGAYELREAIRELDVQLVLGGPILEDRNFWQGLRTTPLTALDQPTNIAAVVLPSLIENRPRRLLAAISAGIPVIASEACGVSNLQGVTTIPTGDSNSLRQAVAKALHITAKFE
jgi:hypothetical protein